MMADRYGVNVTEHSRKDTSGAHGKRNHYTIYGATERESFNFRNFDGPAAKASSSSTWPGKEYRSSKSGILRTIYLCS